VDVLAKIGFVVAMSESPRADARTVLPVEIFIMIASSDEILTDRRPAWKSEFPVGGPSH
jgi:hypothetical protein